MPEPTAHPDYLAKIRAHAAGIKDLTTQVAAGREALRKELRAADRTGRYSREQLVTAARGGLSRALVLKHLGDVSGTVRRALQGCGLEADVAIRRDGTVIVSGVELRTARADTYQSPGQDGVSDPEEDDPGYRLALDTDRLTLLNAVGGLLTDLHRAGLAVAVAVGGDGDPFEPGVTLARGGTVTVTRRDDAA